MAKLGKSLFKKLFKKKSSTKHSDGADKKSASKPDTAADTNSNTELTAGASNQPPHGSYATRHKPVTRSSEGVVSSLIGLIVDGFICAVSKSSSLIWSYTFPDSISSRPISAQHQNKSTNQSTAKKSKSGADKPSPHSNSCIASRSYHSSSNVQYGPAGNRVERFIYGIFSFFFGVMIIGFSFGVFVLWLILSLFIGPVSALAVTVSVVGVFVFLVFMNSHRD